MIICFDFDNTLTDSRIEKLAKKFIEERNEVWIVTMRRDNEYSQKFLQPLLDRLKLTAFNVIYCNEKPKIDFLEGIGADLYIDNVSNEFEEIINKTEIVPLLWYN